MTREEAIKRFENMRKDAQVVLDSGFGTNPGEHDTLYRRRVELAEIALQALHEQEKNRWIPVTERLPEGECIALGNQNEMIIGYIGDSEYSFTGYAAENDGEHLDDVTHWMPLPEPPKGD